MDIGRANLEDLKDIRELNEKYTIEPGHSDGRLFGFYDYSLSPEQIRRRSESPFSIIVKKDSKLEGFCLAYDSDFVKKLQEEEPELSNYAFFRYLTELSMPYLFVDEGAVKNPGTTLGSLAAYKLAKELIRSGRESGIPSILGAISHEPWRNISSINFAQKLGARLRRELNISEIGFAVGIYELKI